MHPEHLYRYFSFEKGHKFLQTRRLYLSSIAEFNDPFECLPVGQKIDDSIFNPSMAGIVEIMQKAVGTGMICPPSYIGIGGIVLSLYSMWQKARTEKKRKIIEAIYRDITTQIRMCCFSEELHNLLMWSHYTRGHTGMVIGFNTTLEYWPGDNFFQVSYSKQRIDANVLRSSEQTKLGPKWQHDLLCTKSEVWTYEKEWRYIKKADFCHKTKSGKAYDLLPVKTIDAIYLGCRITPNNKEKIINLCKHNYSDIPLYQALPNEQYYRLTYQRIAL